MQVRGERATSMPTWIHFERAGPPFGFAARKSLESDTCDRARLYFVYQFNLLHYILTQKN